MSVRLGDSTAGTIERWLSGLGGPTLTEDPPADPDATQAYGGGGDVQRNDYREPPHADYADADLDRYDEDFEYYWGNFKVPLWIALIWQVPWRQRLDIFVAGLLVGLVIAGIAVLWGLLISQY